MILYILFYTTMVAMAITLVIFLISALHGIHNEFEAELQQLEREIRYEEDWYNGFGTDGNDD